MQLFIAAALVVVAAAASTSYSPAPAYHQQSYDTPAQYSYEYDVHGYGDDAPQFNVQEDRDGYSTKGSYSVALPDGRIQTVTYTVNGDEGYVAEVTYEGEAQYPAYNPQPAYKAQSGYKPAYKPAYQ